MGSGAVGKTATARAAQGAHDRAAVLERLRAKRPMRAEYRIPLSDGPVEAVRDARTELTRREDALVAASSPAALVFMQEQVELAREALDKAIADADADSVLLVFEGLPREAFNALLDEHQPTKDDAAAGKDYDPQTFPPALIAATCVEPGFDSAEQVVELIADWNTTERQALFGVAMSTCLATRVADWGKGSAATRA